MNVTKPTSLESEKWTNLDEKACQVSPGLGAQADPDNVSEEKQAKKNLGSSKVLNQNLDCLETALGTFSVQDLESLVHEKEEMDLIINEKIMHMAEIQDQNAQLWKLVNKQRTTIFELQQDLDRALEKNEKYRAMLGRSSQMSSPRNSIENSSVIRSATDALVSPLKRNGRTVPPEVGSGSSSSVTAPSEIDTDRSLTSSRSSDARDARDVRETAEPDFNTTSSLSSSSTLASAFHEDTRPPIPPLNSVKRRAPPLLFKPQSPVSPVKDDNTSPPRGDKRTSLPAASALLRRPNYRPPQSVGPDSTRFKRSEVDQSSAALRPLASPSSETNANEVLCLNPAQVTNISVLVSRVLLGKVKPSLKPGREDPVAILSVVDSSGRLMWQIIKDYSQLQALDDNIRATFSNTTALPKLPDRSLFQNQAPVRVDVRREQLKAYFAQLTRLECLTPNAKDIISKFLSSNIIEISPQKTKSGFLSKRGKSFGGWKTRYFVHNGPYLDYFEKPEGEHLGSITIYSAQIGRQDPSDEINEADDDKKYKHALMIRELKKRGTKEEWVAHMLCAESDEERDSWIQSLIQFVNVRTQVDLIASNKLTPWSLKGYAKKSSLTLSSSINSASMDDDDFTMNSVTVLTPTTPSRVTSVQSPVAKRHISGPVGIQRINEPEKWGGRTNGTLVEENGDGDIRKSKVKNFFVFRKPIEGSYAGVGLNGHASGNTTESDLPPPDSATLNSGFNVSAFDHVPEPVSDSSVLFGASLKHALELSSSVRDGYIVPSILVRCLELLEAKHAAYEEGLFRLNGSNSAIENMEALFNKNYDVDLVDLDANIHAVAGLLKRFLRDIPTRIIPGLLEYEFQRALENKDMAARVKDLTALTNRLPRECRDLLGVLCGFLSFVLKNTNLNKMNIKNLCIVFSPTLHIPFNVFASFLIDYDAIFKGKEPDLDLIRPTIDVPSQLIT